MIQPTDELKLFFSADTACCSAVGELVGRPADCRCVWTSLLYKLAHCMLSRALGFGICKPALPPSRYGLRTVRADAPVSNSYSRRQLGEISLRAEAEAAAAETGAAVTSKGSSPLAAGIAGAAVALPLLHICSLNPKRCGYRWAYE